MKIGSLVLTVGNFEGVRKTRGLPYPRVGQILTISAITKHGNPEVAAKGIVLLHFDEIPKLTGVCDKTVDGEYNFIELLPHPPKQESIKTDLKLTP